MHGLLDSRGSRKLREEQRVSGLISVVFKGAARENGQASEPWFDRNAQKRSFQPGDQVLISLPVPPTSTGTVAGPQQL